MWRRTRVAAERLLDCFVCWQVKRLERQLTRFDQR
jgi:hypothetical protein